MEQCYYEAFVRLHVLQPAGMSDTQFRIAEWARADAAPTWLSSYLHAQMQGVVSDGNAYALGGVAGHAGLFSTAPDIVRLAVHLLEAGPQDAWINANTVRTFVHAQNLTQSSRALGWETNHYTMDPYRGCGNLSSTTYYHTGYTGTLVRAGSRVRPLRRALPI